MKQKEEIICCRKFMKNIRNLSLNPIIRLSDICWNTNSNFPW